MDLTIVDVFAEQPFAGNQLAVVRDAAALDTTQMQAIALETNFSETTFVTREGDGEADVRIFTPTAELPFAGHPTLGTAWVLAAGRSEYVLNLGVGPVPVSFSGDSVWMVPPPVDLLGSFPAPSAAELVNLEESRLAAEFPIRLAQVGPKFVLIGVRDLAALRAASLNGPMHEALVADGVGVNCVFLFTTEGYSAESSFAARMFFNAGGVREDSATGSANSAFAAYLRGLQGPQAQVIVDQGVEMGRPSRLYLDVGEPIRVGGKVREILRGSLLVLPGEPVS